MSAEQLLKEMGERIYTRRRTLGFTQETLAEQMNVSPQMISNLELGKKAIRPENLKRLCQVLNVSADSILMGQEAYYSPSAQLADKLLTLSPDHLQLVNQIIDMCLQCDS